MLSSEKLRYPYTRPEFLYFSDDEIGLSADQSTRPVLCPKDPSRMPVYAGYAEVINAGKSTLFHNLHFLLLLTTSRVILRRIEENHLFFFFGIDPKGRDESE